MPPSRALGPHTLAFLMALLGSCGSETNREYVASIEAWHAQRLEHLRAEDGWLTLVGLHPLHPGTNTVGSAPGQEVRLSDTAPDSLGVFAVDEDGIFFVARQDAQVYLDGVPEHGLVRTITLITDGQAEPTVLATGALRFYVIERGGRYFVREKNRDSALRREFRGIDRFPVDRRWRVMARLEPHDPPRTVAIGNALGQVDESPTPGTLAFVLAGQACRLTPMGDAGEPLFIVFADETTGESTYGGGRFLSTDAPDSAGMVVLDFNLATNPPCVFTPYATCPLPPAENLLPVAVEAGEKMWGWPH